MLQIFTWCHTLFILIIYLFKLFPALLIIFQRFFGSNQNRTRTELTEPVLSVLVQSGSGSGEIPTVRFSVLYEGAENRTEPNFGNTNLDIAITDFIETENGTIVSADTARSIRNLARSVLIEMDTHPVMQLPKKWGQVGVTERKFFIREMYAKFPILWLCHDDWKVLLIASNAVRTYHSGYKTSNRSCF